MSYAVRIVRAAHSAPFVLLLTVELSGSAQHVADNTKDTNDEARAARVGCMTEP